MDQRALLTRYRAFFRFLKTTPLASCAAQLEQRSRDRLANLTHSDLGRWQGAIEALPQVKATSVDLDADAVSIGSADQLASRSPDAAQEALREGLMQLRPWRKGPFDLFGLRIDAEWCSNLKWDRLKREIGTLEGRRVLDVGCGNGYYLLRMLGQGAQAVVGVDPNLLHVMQFHALNSFLTTDRGSVLPLGVEDVPADCACFDCVFSMGVLYHQRSPQEHLEQLLGFLRPGGLLVLETLIWEHPRAEAFVPEGTYAKMRNVWSIPAPSLLVDWLKRTGFTRISCIDTTQTTEREQRQTPWMTYASLSDFLDRDDANKTVEGHPAPVRSIMLARRP